MLHENDLIRITTYHIFYCMSLLQNEIKKLSCTFAGIINVLNSNDND